jgi:hypothetical protein
MLIEQHKQVLHLQQEIEVLQSTLRDIPADDGDRKREQEG